MTPRFKNVTLAVGLSLLAAGCGSGGSTSTPTPAVTVTAAASPAFDAATLRACKEADASMSAGIGNEHGSSALMAAKLSDQGALRDLEAKVDSALFSKEPLDQTHVLTAVIEISTWCLNHKVAH